MNVGAMVRFVIATVDAIGEQCEHFPVRIDSVSYPAGTLVC